MKTEATERMYRVWYLDWQRTNTGREQIRSFDVEADDAETAAQIAREQLDGLVEVEDVEVIA